MRLWGSWVYETYFSSVDKVVMATIEVSHMHTSKSVFNVKIFFR